MAEIDIDNDNIVPGPDNNWGNPPTGEMLRDHTLASRIIANHGTPREILDASELEILRQFAADPTSTTQERVLSERDMLDTKDTTGADIGTAARHKGSLAGYVVARYGKVAGDANTFRSDEVTALNNWFKSGGGQ